MAIYLDTGVVCRWRNFDTVDRLALSIAADQLGQEVVMPELAVVEAMAHRERELAEVLDHFKRAEGDLKLHLAIEEVHTEPAPDLERRMRDWRRQLDDFCAVLPMDPSDAVSALKREVHGQSPARARTPGKAGAGARDAAIWLAVLRDHRRRTEPGFFVTTNPKDFLDGSDLKPGLATDLAGMVYPLEVKVRVDGLLETLGTSAEPVEINPAAVTGAASEVVRLGLAETNFVPMAVFTESAGNRFRTSVTRCEATKVISSRRFSRGDESLLAVDAEWSLLVDCLFQDVNAAEEGPWGAIRDVHLSGRIQIYLPEGSGIGGGELITARLRSDQIVGFLENGDPLILGPKPPWA